MRVHKTMLKSLLSFIRSSSIICPKYTNNMAVIGHHMTFAYGLGHGGTTQGSSQPGLGLGRARSQPLPSAILSPQRQRPSPPILSPSSSHSIMAEQLVLRGTLEGHNGWVTSLATSLEK